MRECVCGSRGRYDLGESISIRSSSSGTIHLEKAHNKAIAAKKISIAPYRKTNATTASNSSSSTLVAHHQIAALCVSPRQVCTEFSLTFAAPNKKTIGIIA